MSIRLKDGYTATRTDSLDEAGGFRRAGRMITVTHPAGGSYSYIREPKAAPLEYLRVPPEARRAGRAKDLLDHFTGHLDHRRLPSALQVAPLERGITPQGLVKLYRSRGWQGSGPDMRRAARSIVR